MTVTANGKSVEAHRRLQKEVTMPLNEKRGNELPKPRSDGRDDEGREYIDDTDDDEFEPIQGIVIIQTRSANGCDSKIQCTQKWSAPEMSA